MDTQKLRELCDKRDEMIRNLDTLDKQIAATAGNAPIEAQPAPETEAQVGTTCSYCKGKGHTKRNCPKRKDDEETQKGLSLLPPPASPELVPESSVELSEEPQPVS